MFSEPDYDKYIYEQLLDVNENIDKEQYPERFNKIKKCLIKIESRKEAAFSKYYKDGKSSSGGSGEVSTPGGDGGC